MESVPNQELLGVRSERLYSNTTRGVRRRVEAIAALNRWTLSKTIHVLMLLGLTVYEQELARAKAEREEQEQEQA